MNQKKHNTGFLEEFENFNWRELNFNEQLEHFTYSENEQLSPQFSYFSAGQNEQLQAQAFMPHAQYPNNSMAPSNLLGLQQLMMVQQKKEFPSQQISINGVELSGIQQNIKLVSPFQNTYNNSQQIVTLGANQNISLQNQGISSNTLHICHPMQQQQHQHQEDAIMNMKECNQNHLNQQQFSPFKQIISQPDIEGCSDTSMSLLQDKSRSKDISFEQQSLSGICQGSSQSNQADFNSRAAQAVELSNITLKSHSSSSNASQPQKQVSNKQDQALNQLTSLLPFNFSDDKTYENEGVGKKRRGRRKIEDDQYYAITNDKIQEWEYILQNSKNLSKKDKKILRNRISAQKSRNKKKEEFGHLNTQIDELKDRYRQLFQILEENTCSECKDNIINQLQQGQNKRQKTSHTHSHANVNSSGCAKGLGKNKNFMKVMLGFVANENFTQ